MYIREARNFVQCIMGCRIFGDNFHGLLDFCQPMKIVSGNLKDRLPSLPLKSGMSHGITRTLHVEYCSEFTTQRGFTTRGVWYP
jgi:hypothetical protein